MSTPNRQKEPALRIAKRDGISRPKAYAIRILAVLLSLVVSGIFIFAVTKLDPMKVYKAMFDGAFGSSRRFWVTIRDTMMLLCIGVGLAPAFKMKFWNVGAEGQVLVGGIFTAGLMRAYGNENPHAGPTGDHGGRQSAGRLRVGRHPRHLQGPLEHQRDPLHPDDELRGHPTDQLLRGAVGKSLRVQYRGRHQPADKGRLVPPRVRPDLWPERHHRPGADRGDVPLSEVLQAGV